jgi:hypothetical protein
MTEFSVIRKPGTVESTTIRLADSSWSMSLTEWLPQARTMPRQFLSGESGAS